MKRQLSVTFPESLANSWKLGDKEFENEIKIKNSEVLNLLNDLDAGEAEVIVLATEIVADLVIMDETLGRRFAKYSDLTVTGIIGVLIKAKEMGIVKAISPLLDEMQQKGIWINNKLKLKVLKKVNEESEQN